VRPLLLGAALALVACQERPRPWDQGDAEAPPPPPRSSSTAIPLGSIIPAEPPPAGSAGAGPAHAAEPAWPPVRVGGPWVSCYGNFRPSGEPVKDVTRLSLLCGPENGMRRLSKQPIEGAVAEGGPAVAQPFEARRGDCYRVFAVAEPSVGDLDVTVQSGHGAAIAADHGEDGWPIVQPDRPFCPLADDRYTVEITARRGRGRFAAEVWVLRSPTEAPGRHEKPSVEPTD